MDQPKYRIEIFWSGEDGGYIANVPDLRYCSAFGETYEEALREVLVAMELHLETLREHGREIPQPEPRRGASVSSILFSTGEVVEFAEEPGGGISAEVSEEIGRLFRNAVEDAHEERRSGRFRRRY